MLAPKTRILYCRKTEKNWNKADFEEKKQEFRELQEKIKDLMEFEQRILDGEYKGLIENKEEAFCNPFAVEAPGQEKPLSTWEVSTPNTKASKSVTTSKPQQDVFTNTGFTLKSEKTPTSEKSVAATTETNKV